MGRVSQSSSFLICASPIEARMWRLYCSKAMLALSLASLSLTIDWSDRPIMCRWNMAFLSSMMHRGNAMATKSVSLFAKENGLRKTSRDLPSLLSMTMATACFWMTYPLQRNMLARITTMSISQSVTNLSAIEMHLKAQMAKKKCVQSTSLTTWTSLWSCTKLKHLRDWALLKVVVPLLLWVSLDKHLRCLCLNAP